MLPTPKYASTSASLGASHRSSRRDAPNGSIQGTIRDVVTATPRVIATITRPVVITVDELTKRYGSFST